GVGVPIIGFDLASMEPRLFSRGYSGSLLLAEGRIRRLQWSHGCSAVDTAPTWSPCATRLSGPIFERSQAAPQDRPDISFSATSQIPSALQPQGFRAVPGWCRITPPLETHPGHCTSAR